MRRIDRRRADQAHGAVAFQQVEIRIEIEKIECARVDTCRATGKVDYITSNEVAHGGVFMRRAITLQLARTSTNWRITKVQLEPARS
jgi:hypothetical protein